MWLFFLLPVLASPATILTCFSSEQSGPKTVKRGNTVCAMELNLYNLGCLSPPLMTLYDVETSFATTDLASKLGKKEAACFREDHYIKCYCTWDRCNLNWKNIHSRAPLNVSSDKVLSKCVEEKCGKGHLCSSYGTKLAEKFNYYALPMEYTFSPPQKKDSNMNTVEMVILWTTGGGILLAVVSLVIYEFVARRSSSTKTLIKEKRDVETAEASGLQKPTAAPSAKPSKKEEAAKPSSKKSEKKIQ